MRAVGGILAGLVTLLVLFPAASSRAVPGFPDKIPNSDRVGLLHAGNVLLHECTTCHDSAVMQGCDNLNPFGLQFRKVNLSASDPTWVPTTAVPCWVPRSGAASMEEIDQKFQARAAWEWTQAVATGDADEDGFTNGQELQDPNGVFAGGSTTFGVTALVAEPGDPNSFPPSVVAAFPGNLEIRNLSSDLTSTPADLTFSVAYRGSNGPMAPTSDFVPVTATSDAPWLFLAPGATTTAGTLRFQNISALAPSAVPYTAHVTVSASHIYKSDTLTVNLTVTLPSTGSLCGTAAEECTAGACCKTEECRFRGTSFSCSDATDCAPEVFCLAADPVCPAPVPYPSDHVCREAANDCQLDVTCDGGLDCPAANVPSGAEFCGEVQLCSSALTCVDPEPIAQSKDQISCLDKWNKAAGTAATAHAKQAADCFAKGLKGKLSGDLDACIGDASAKTDRVVSKADRAARARCAGAEKADFGTSATSDLSLLASDALANAYGDVFGPDLDAVVPADEPAAAKCQAAVSKSLSKCLAGRVASFSKCVTRGLKSKTTPIESFPGVQSCIGFESNSAHLACKVEEGSKTWKALNARCPNDPALLGDAFPGCVPATDVTGDLERDSLYGCIDRASQCRVCEALKAWGHLGTDCKKHGCK